MNARNALRRELELAQGRLAYLDLACLTVERGVGRRIPALSQLSLFIRAELLGVRATLGTAYRLNEEAARAELASASAEAEPVPEDSLPV